MRCRCLLKQTRISHLSSLAATMFDENKFNPKALVTWLITLLLIICPSSYKAHPDNLIGLNSFWSGIIPPQRSNARPNFPTSNVVGGAKFVWYPGYFFPIIYFLNVDNLCQYILYTICLKKMKTNNSLQHKITVNDSPLRQ